MSTGASPTPSPDFNPFNQPFTLIGGDGVAFNATMGDVNHLGEYGIRLAINYGTQLSASVVLLLLLLLVIRREKQRSAIFTLNALCLSINFIRSLLQCLYLTGNYWNMYSQLAHDASRDSWKDKANTVASNTFTLLLVICIMISLSMQVWVVCKTASTIQRMVIMCTTSAMALVAIGYRFAVTVISNHLAMESQSMSSYVSLLDQMTIMQAVAIWLYCAIFTAKLGHALVQRRKLGLTQFGPMQIVLIMGLQCMIVPAIFSALQYYEAVPELGSQTLTIVCISLPLSAIWAGTITNDSSIAGRGPGAAHRLLQDHFGRGSPSQTTTSLNGPTKMGTVDSQLKEPYSPTSAKKEQVDSEDGHIYVDHEWSVEKGEPSSNAYDRV